jgi:Uma2 family endonuclease
MTNSVTSPPTRELPPEPLTLPLQIPPRTGLKVSVEDFERLCAANPDLRLERASDGELIAMAPAGLESSAQNAGVTAQLWNWNQRTALGVVFDSSAGVTLPNSAIRGPDAMWITRDRWDALPKTERRRFGRLSPDFVVEVRSDSNDRETLRAKMREYIANGVLLAWLIDPIAGEVEIHRPNLPPETLTNPATLSGENVLPGFVLVLSGILLHESPQPRV